MTEETDAGSEQPLVEPRWPVVVTVSAFIVLTVVLRVVVPRRESVGPHWFIPGLEIVLLMVLLAAHPMHVDKRSTMLRRVSIALMAVLVAAAVTSNAILIAELIKGSKVTESADSLLASGVLAWTGNAVLFSLLYWQLDSGGPLARARAERRYPDFAFT